MWECACLCVPGYNLLVTLGLILGAVILHERGLQAEASTQMTATHFAVSAASAASRCCCCLSCFCCCFCRGLKQVPADGAKGLMRVGGCNHSNRKSGEKSCYMVFVTASYMSHSPSPSLSMCHYCCLAFLGAVCPFYFGAVAVNVA